MKANMVAVGAYLRRLREHKGLSATQVGALLETGEGQIRNVEKGRTDTRGSFLVNFGSIVDANLNDIAELMLSEADEERARQLQRVAEGSAEYCANSK